MVNGQTIPISQADVSKSLSVGIYSKTGERIAEQKGGKLYTVQGYKDMYFRTYEEAESFAATKGYEARQVGVEYTPEGRVVDSAAYWKQKEAEESRRQAAYGGVRTEAALAPVGKPTPGLPLEAKVKYLERGTAQFASEEQFKRAAESVGQYTPVSAKGVVVTPGFKTGEEQLKAMEPTITPPETQKFKLPETPRGTTEAFMKRISEGDLTEPSLAPYGTDIFGTPRTRPGRVIYPGQEESIPMQIFRGAKEVSTIGLGFGFGEALTTSSALRGAKLIQPGDVAAIQRAVKTFKPSVPEFIKSEAAEATLVPIRRTPTRQILEPPKPISEEKVITVDITKELVMPKPLKSVLELPKAIQIEKHLPAMARQRLKSGYQQMMRPSQLSRMEKVTIQKTTLQTEPISMIRYKPLGIPILAQKETAIQEQQTRQVSITKEMTAQVSISKQLQKTMQVSPQVQVSRTVTPQVTRQEMVTPTISKAITETVTIPKDITKGVEPSRGIREIKPPKPIRVPVPDLQILPKGRKKKRKQRKGERILKLYPIGIPESILGIKTPKTKKKKSKKR